MPGASVSLQPQSPPGPPLTGVTNAGGAYRFFDLAPGIYTATVTQGTQTVRSTEVRVPVGTTVTIDFKLPASGGAPDVQNPKRAGPVVDVTAAHLAITLDQDELRISLFRM